MHKSPIIVTQCVFLLQVLADGDVENRDMILSVGSRERVVEQGSQIIRVGWGSMRRGKGIPGCARTQWPGTVGSSLAEQRGLQLLHQEASCEKVGGHRSGKGSGGWSEESVAFL